MIQKDKEKIQDAGLVMGLMRKQFCGNIYKLLITEKGIYVKSNNFEVIVQQIGHLIKPDLSPSIPYELGIMPE